MPRYLFYSFLLVIQIFRLPISFLVIVLKNLLPKLGDRLAFERKNLNQSECISFKSFNSRADFCFEVSSEGELEQVFPLIDHYLKKNKKIELIFASPSVEKKCFQLAVDFPLQVRILRLPIASIFPINFLYFQSVWQWVSAETILLCRYDFYPELLLFGVRKNLILLSAASKKLSWFKASAFACFDYIIAANNDELEYFKNTYPLIKSDAFDFRIPQIFKRIGLKNEKLNQFKNLAPYLNYLENHSRESMLILGSAWFSDLIIFEEHILWQNKIEQDNFHLLIVPHSLDESNLKAMREKLETVFGRDKVAQISERTVGQDHSLIHSPPPVIILDWRGILCELYTFFDFAYVGGGLERSIHSVLEPFLAGNKVLVTGVVSRSAEYDYLKSIAPNEIYLLNNGQSFYNLFNESILTLPDKNLRSQIKEEASQKMLKVLNEITNVK